MAGVVLETLSWKKLIILGVSLLILLITFFLIGGLVAPNPSNVVVVLGTNCINDKGRGNKEWFIPHGGNERCRSVDSLDGEEVESGYISANQIVFSFWLPYKRDGKRLDFSRWQQSLISVLQVEILFSEQVPLDDKAVLKLAARIGYRNKEDDVNDYRMMKQFLSWMPRCSIETRTIMSVTGRKDDDAVLKLDARIGYRNKEDDVNDWKEIATSLEERKLNCHIDDNRKQEGFAYDCELLPLFELGSLHHDYYLVNIKVPTEPYQGVNMNIGKLREMTLVAIHQNGGFTKVWVSIKTVMFPMVLAVLVWYWRRIGMLERPHTLLERTIFALGIAMSVLNCPLEWFTLAIDMPFMMIVTDIRQGGFYAMLMSFWIIFTGEHIMDTTERNRLNLYWKHLLAVVIGCFCMLLFEICERGVQLTNPFFSIWVTDIGTKLALAFIIIAGVAASAYFFFLCYMIFLVFRNISSKRMLLPSMSSGRRTYYMGLIYRFKFLMLATLVCAAVTVVFFILSQLSEGQWKWSEDDLKLEYTSAFFTGVYGMWNVYVIGLLSLYAPSHKQMQPQAAANEDSQEEEVQLTCMPSSTEGASTFQTFATKAAQD